jgi:16S rRNA (cytosine967-C5)-methyltransferase
MKNTRELAIAALEEVAQRGAKPKDVLDRLSGSLDSRDRAFLMELVYGALRHRDILDWVLKAFLKKASGLAAPTMNNLRLAAYQILFMRVPEWAAVNEAVELEKAQGRPTVVNGVLRNLLRNIGDIRARLSRMRTEPTPDRIALLASHPLWLVRRWVARFGTEGARELAEANNRIPPLTLRINTLNAGREELITGLSAEGIEAEPTLHSPDGLRLKEFRAFRELPFSSALIAQDEASQLISYLLGPQPGERILDACAAPGGKTTHLAQLMRNTGEIVAVEYEKGRLRQIEENLSRLGITSVTVVNADARNLETTPLCLENPGRCLFDRILLDAPCSSLGVIRRNPDVKYRHTAGQLGQFRARQTGLLSSVSKLLKSGGTMVYSVCSTEPEEGEEVIREFLEVSPEFSVVRPEVPFLEEFMNDGFFRTYPHRDNMDGFFGARLCKKA